MHYLTNISEFSPCLSSACGSFSPSDSLLTTSVVEAKMVTPILKLIHIPVFFIQEKVENCLFVLKYKNSGIILADICTKTCLVPIISRITEWITGFCFYSSSDTKHHQIMKLQEFGVT